MCCKNYAKLHFTEFYQFKDGSALVQKGHTKGHKGQGKLGHVDKSLGNGPKGHYAKL